MAHRTVRWCTGQGTVHCPVPATSADHWGLEQLTVGVFCPLAAPDSPVAHRTCLVRSDFIALTSDLCTVHLFIVHRSQPLAQLTVIRWLIGHVRCTPDSPVNYSEASPIETREWPVRGVLGLGTGQCPVRHWQH
jgi:hypothetical protein